MEDGVLGRWCWEKISFELPSVVLEKILATPMQLFGEKNTPWFGNSLKMENSALPRHMIWPDLKIQTPILSRGIGYGSLTPYQKSSISYGFATTIAFRCGKSLLLGAYPATRAALMPEPGGIYPTPIKRLPLCSKIMETAWNPSIFN